MDFVDKQQKNWFTEYCISHCQLVSIVYHVHKLLLMCRILCQFNTSSIKTGYAYVNALSLDVNLKQIFIHLLEVDAFTGRLITFVAAKSHVPDVPWKK